MKHKFLLIVTTITFCTNICNKVHAQVDVNDSLALVDLYNSTNGPSWTYHANWLNGRVRNWYGITVESGRVTAIALNNNNLSGILPASIGNLTKVRNITLSINKISGNIPEEIGQLRSLKYLGLFKNQLSGFIPHSISHLANLESLFLANNLLTGTITDSIVILRKLIF